MAPRFDRLDASAGRAVAGVYGEPVLITPRGVDQYAGAAPDLSRPARTVTGVYYASPAEMDAMGQVKGRDPRGGTILRGAETAVMIPARHASAIPFQIFRGDLVTLTDRSGSPSFAVVDLPVLDTGDLLLILTAEASP